MKQSLQLKFSQHLALTPQLQQSIRLLQLSTQELNQELETLLQENPLLERADKNETGLDNLDGFAPFNTPQETSAPVQDENPQQGELGEDYFESTNSSPCCGFSSCTGAEVSCGVLKGAKPSRLSRPVSFLSARSSSGFSCSLSLIHISEP